FWSLAMQQQFYLIWPFVIWFLPRRWLLPFIIVFSIIGPVSRYYHDALTVYVAWPQVLTCASFDYFGIGALYALALHRGVSLESPGLRWISGIAFAGYLAVFGAYEMGWATFGMRPLQQTFLSFSICGLITAATVGFTGPIGKFLLHPVLQRIGMMSYGIYLFHNLAPLLAGKLFWFLWGDSFHAEFWDWFRIAIYAAVTWALSLASWRWIEKPLQDVRSRISS
ncbi:MAG: acyltransferase, partial [Gloeobacteraceae cyanobacterium ES-bin-144]|nr:acyltransferase [Verrucomicrobiales bacterium]